MEFVRHTPWWLVLLLYVTTLLLGIYVGAPITDIDYELTIPSEVAELFALLAFVHWYYLIILCLLATLGFKYVRKKKNMVLDITYLVCYILLVPIVFYGIEVSNYYSYKI